MKAEYSLFYIIYWIPKWSTNCQITFASTSWSRNHCTHPALLRPIDPLQQQRALALLLRILRSKPYRASRWIRWLDHRQNDAHVNVPFFFLMKWRTLKAQTPFENTQAIWEWADTTWRKSPILGGRSECSDTVAWKLICIWTLDVVNECKWRIQGKWGLCWEHFQLSHSRALSWAVFLFGRWRSRCHQRRHLEFGSSNDRPMSGESGLITSAVEDHLQETCWENYFDPRGCCRSTGPTDGTNRFFSSADIPDDKSPTTHCGIFSWCLDMFGYVFNIVWGMGNKMDLSRAKCSGWYFAQTCHLHLILIA